MSSPTPPDYARWLKQPSIIVDPEVYPEPLTGSVPALRARLRAACGVMVGSTACAAVVAVTVFSVSHADEWLSHGHAHTRADGPERTPATFASVAPVLRAAALESKAAKPAEGGLAAGPASAPSVSTEQPADLVREAVRDGRRLLLRQRFDEAEEVYRAALEVRPGNPALLLGMSKAALAQGDLDRALGYARTAVKRAPSHAVYHSVLGDVLRALGHTAEADAAYERAAKLSPKPVDRVTKILPPNPF